jgi:hydrogenase maturation protease
MDKRITVLGIGNILNSDEGVGVHAVRAMQVEAHRAPDVAFLDGGTLGLNLLSLVEGASHLLILDAVDADRPPGTLVELAKEEIPLFGGVRMSQHQLTFQEVLGLALIRDKLPGQLYLIGVQPASLDIGTELSPQVAAVLPRVVERAWDIVGEWNGQASELVDRSEPGR